MPLIKMETSAPMTDEVKPALAAALSKIAADAIGKPETYVMASVSQAVMSMSGTPAPAAFIDVRSIGALNQSVNRDLTKRVSALLKEKLDLPADRIYVSFNDVSGVNWGWNNSTFG